MNGIILIDKPEGITSFCVVRAIKRIFNQKKVGHAGTLDPLATGLLPVLLGEATKIERFLPQSGKSYTAGFKLGITTDTQDITGSILKEFPVNIREKELIATAKSFLGKISQLPPMYSAVRVEGKRLYELAREGKTIERKPKEAFISSIELMAFDPSSHTGIMCIECSKGTYIRTLLADIGDELGCGCTMTSLRRTFTCGFSLTDAISIDTARELSASGDISSRVIPTEKALSLLPSIKVTAPQATRFSSGGGLIFNRLTGLSPENDLYLVFRNEKLLGIAKPDFSKDELIPERILNL
jgi:tRNA pseudouridine55 synthase